VRLTLLTRLPTAGCVDTDLPVGRCDYARSDKSVGESACLHHAMWVDHTETCFRATIAAYFLGEVLRTPLLGTYHHHQSHHRQQQQDAPHKRPSFPKKAGLVRPAVLHNITTLASIGYQAHPPNELDLQKCY